MKRKFFSLSGQNLPPVSQALAIQYTHFLGDKLRFIDKIVQVFQQCLIFSHINSDLMSASQNMNLMSASQNYILKLTSVIQAHVYFHDELHRESFNTVTKT